MRACPVCASCACERVTRPSKAGLTTSVCVSCGVPRGMPTNALFASQHEARQQSGRSSFGPAAQQHARRPPHGPRRVDRPLSRRDVRAAHRLADRAEWGGRRGDGADRAACRERARRAAVYFSAHRRCKRARQTRCGQQLRHRGAGRLSVRLTPVPSLRGRSRTYHSENTTRAGTRPRTGCPISSGYSTTRPGCRSSLRAAPSRRAHAMSCRSSRWCEGTL